MKKGLVPAPAVGGSWRDGIWNLAIGIINFLLGNNQIVRGITQLASYGYERLRGVFPVPYEDQLDGPVQQEENPVQPNNRDAGGPGAEGVVSRDQTDAPVQPRNRGPHAARGAMGNEPSGTDRPDTDTSYHGGPAADAGKTLHYKKITKTGNNCPTVMDARNCTVTYARGSEQGGSEQGDETQTKTLPSFAAGADRIEIDEINFKGDNSPFMFSAVDTKINYRK